MHTCPQCGYEDPPCWRQNRWVSAVDYSRIEDFQDEYPKFAEINPGETLSDKYCYYYRGKKQRAFVYRWSKTLDPQYYPRTRHMFERHVPRRPPLPGQKTLAAAPTSVKYGVWCNPTRIGKRGDDYYQEFPTKEKARDFIKGHPEADKGFFEIPVAAPVLEVS